MTCIGNSGPLDPAIVQLTDSQSVVGAAVLSGNRNFQGRINPAINAAYLASPALVVAYALAGSVLTDLRREPLGRTQGGQPILLADLWPDDREIQEILRAVVTPDAFRARAAGVFLGPPQWQKLGGAEGVTFQWRGDSTYLRSPPYFDTMPAVPEDLRDLIGARALLVLGDNITTDHISPAGSIPRDSLAGRYLAERGVPASEFNQYSTRRGNHEVMLRGIFTNPRLHNELMGPGSLGGQTRLPSGATLPVYNAAQQYRRGGTPLVIFAGRDYGAGSSRDWAAKGPALLGVRAVIAESFERIHRSNLIGMGILPLQFVEGMTRHGLKLNGGETIDLLGLGGGLSTRQILTLAIRRDGAETARIPVMLRAETELETEYLRHGGLLRHLLRNHVQPGPAPAAVD